MTKSVQIGKTVVSKNMRGDWQAESAFLLRNISEHKNQILQVQTSKRGGGIMTTGINAGVEEKIPGQTFTSFSFAMFGDYSKSVNHGKVRVTEKTVAEHHAKVIAEMDTYYAEACKYYAPKAAA